ncbi:hypothetical protein FU371_00205 [Campylobacter jejuni]|nr:hypothetical protein [Campylobacter jejuni]ECL2360244.1 hypothetical protein [Campylobacter jejuni]ECL3806076.1 hypothetical protein [Campylobacter jejuni]ECP8536953.1 hypothetical protein [Campylobacter jejuni]ECP8550480.1 hypothetical protein [Campylobacter jejuni]
MFLELSHHKGFDYKKHSKYKVYLNFKLFKLKISSFLNRFIFYIFAVKTKSALIKNLFFD